MLRAHPGLRLDISFALPSVLERQVAEGDLDFAILVQSPERTGLEVERIYSEEFVAVAAPRLASDLAAPITARALREKPFAVFSRDMPMHAAWWRTSFGRKEALPEKIVCSVASLDELLALAEKGLAVVVLPTYIVERSVRAGRVNVVRPKAGRPAKNPIFLVWRPRAAEPARVRVVREALLSPHA